MIRPTINTRHIRHLAVGIKIAVAVTLVALLLMLLNHSSPATAISQAGGNAGRAVSALQASSLTNPDNADSGHIEYPVDVIPLDETTVLITVQGVDLPTATLFANVSIGPGHVKHSYAMTKSGELANSLLNAGHGQGTGAYAIATGFSPYEDITASLTITAVDAQLAALDFDRAYVPLIEEGHPPDEVQDRFQRFGLYIDGGTFPDDNYMTLIPDPATTPPVPDGYTLLGDIFDINSLGDASNTDKIMELRFYPGKTWLDGHAVQTLAILMRDPATDTWTELLSGRRLEHREQRVTFTTKFTAYALAATRTWTDSFSFLDGLDAPQDVRLLWSGDSYALALDEGSTDAVVTSIPISLPADGLQWASVAFTGTESAPGTSLQIDLLDNEGDILLDNIDPLADLRGIDPHVHPVLRLRATLTSQAPGASPTLDEWRISWEQSQSAVDHSIHLPIITR